MVCVSTILLWINAALSMMCATYVGLEFALEQCCKISIRQPGFP